MKSSKGSPHTTKPRPSSRRNPTLLPSDPNPTPPRWTIKALLTWTQSYFKTHGVDSLRTDAEILLAHVLGCQRIDLYLRYDQPLNGEELSFFKVLIQRRARREPVAYILGYREFWSRRFKVTPRVLIPRPETEIIVQSGNEILSAHGSTEPAKVFEMGTGSGAIIISLALEHPRHHYFAMDRSYDALKVAIENAHAHLSPDSVRFFCGSWLSPCHPDRARFDLIVSNPPYIARPHLGGLQPEITEFEPLDALDGGLDGLDALKEIIALAPDFMAPGGWLLLEIGHDQAHTLGALVEARETLDSVQWEVDLAGHRRVAKIRKKALRQSL